MKLPTAHYTSSPVAIGRLLDAVLGLPYLLDTSVPWQYKINKRMFTINTKGTMSARSAVKEIVTLRSIFAPLSLMWPSLFEACASRFVQRLGRNILKSQTLRESTTACYLLLFWGSMRNYYNYVIATSDCRPILKSRALR